MALTEENIKIILNNLEKSKIFLEELLVMCDGKVERELLSDWVVEIGQYDSAIAAMEELKEKEK